MVLYLEELVKGELEAEEEKRRRKSDEVTGRSCSEGLFVFVLFFSISHRQPIASIMNGSLHPQLL